MTATGARRWLGLAASLLAVAAGVLALWADSYPAPEFGFGLVAVGLALLAGLGLVALLVVCAVSRRFSIGLVVPVLAFTIAAAAVRFDVPLQVRFGLARTAFEQAIIDRGEAGPSAPCPGWIGSFRIYGCYTSGFDTFFPTPGGFLDTAGIAYLPEGPPGGSGPRAFTELDDPWYTYVEDW